MKKILILCSLLFFSISIYSQDRLERREDGSYRIVREDTKNKTCGQVEEKEIVLPKTILIGEGVTDEELKLFLKVRQDTTYKEGEDESEIIHDSWHFSTEKKQNYTKLYLDKDTLKAEKTESVETKKNQILSIITYMILFVMVIFSSAPLFKKYDRYSNVSSKFCLINLILGISSFVVAYFISGFDPAVVAFFISVSIVSGIGAMVITEEAESFPAVIFVYILTLMITGLSYNCRFANFVVPAFVLFILGLLFAFSND